MNEQEIFAKATAIDSADARSEFLDTACRDNPELRARIERLLKLHASAGSFLEHPAVPGIATELLANTNDGPNLDTAGSRTMPHVDDIPLGRRVREPRS